MGVLRNPSSRMDKTVSNKSYAQNEMLDET